MATSQNLEALLLQKEELQKQIDFLTKAKRLDAIAQVQRMMITYDISCEELQKKVVKKTIKTPAKYQIDDLTWSGKGRKPQWVIDHLATGGKLEDIEIATEYNN